MNNTVLDRLSRLLLSGGIYLFWFAIRTRMQLHVNI